MRRLLLGVLLPIILLLAVGGGIWLFLRSRNASPAPMSPTGQGTGTAKPSQNVESDERAPVFRETRDDRMRAPTEADRLTSAQTERDFFPSEYVEEGEPTHIDTPGYSATADTAASSQPTTAVPIPTEQLENGDADEDGDGLTTDQERQQGTSPLRADTDNDGLTDGDEVRTYRTSPLQPDTDGDGLGDGEEARRWGTDPLNPDTDGDTYTDGAEVQAGYNPNGPGAL